MSGLNSIVGLNKVNVDYRPDVGTVEAPKVQNGANNIINVNVEPEPQEVLPGKSEAKSILRQLDVLLVNAAKRSVMEDVALKTKGMGTTLLSLDVIKAAEADNLAALAKAAAEKLAALDKFTGAEIAGAIAKDGGWSKVAKESLSPVASAVKVALDAQDKLSEALYGLKNRLYNSDKVDGDMMDRFTELLFQCDRRETEINSIVRRMHELAQQDVVDDANGDPKIKELLNAKFMDLMPREALLMHGTADSIELMQKAFGKQIGPLAEKLDAFAADHGKELIADDIAELQTCMTTMKNAIENVRRNGIEVDGSKIGVDNSILKEMEDVLAEVAAKIVDAKQHCVKNMRTAFLDDVRESLLPKSAPLPASAPESPFGKYVNIVNRFIEVLRDHADGNLAKAGLEAEVENLNVDVDKLKLDQNTLVQVGCNAEAAAKMVAYIARLELMATQFMELVKSTAQFANGGPDPMVTAGDIRRMMLGELSVSSVVEARARGFKASDVNTKADDANIVDSKPLGSGQASGTYLLTTKSGEKLVFKPEFDSRIGLSRLSLGGNGSYSNVQNTVNLNLATQDTAKFLGCEDLVVKYSVGSHKGQFGVFMEMASGFSGEDFACKKQGESEDSISPANIKTEIVDEKDRNRVKGQIARQLNRLQWLDVITGQGDRHWNNYFMRIDKKNLDVMLKAIDNDASFSMDRIGVQKYKFSVTKSRYFKNALKIICRMIHGDDRWKAEFDKCWNKSSAITHDVRTGVVTVNMAKIDKKSREVAIALSALIGAQTIAYPDAIDKEFYDKLMELDKTPALKEEYLATIAPRLSDGALKAARMRLDDAIKYAKRLNDANRVFDGAAWRNPANLNALVGLKASVYIYDTNGGNVKMSGQSNQYISDFLIRTCPSYYKRDFMNLLFAEPANGKKGA